MFSYYSTSLFYCPFRTSRCEVWTLKSSRFPGSSFKNVHAEKFPVPIPPNHRLNKICPRMCEIRFVRPKVCRRRLFARISAVLDLDWPVAGRGCGKICTCWEKYARAHGNVLETCFIMAQKIEGIGNSFSLRERIKVDAANMSSTGWYGKNRARGKGGAERRESGAGFSFLREWRTVFFLEDASLCLEIFRTFFQLFKMSEAGGSSDSATLKQNTF